LKEANFVHTRNIRLFSIGAQTLTGVGDARGLGWLGRVLAKTHVPDLQIESYPLVFPNETTEEMSERWEREVIPRLSRDESVENRLVIAVPQDPISMAGSSARARLHLANILDRAKQHSIPHSLSGLHPHRITKRISILPSSTKRTKVWQYAETSYTSMRSPIWSTTRTSTKMSWSTKDYQAKPLTVSLLGWC